MVAHRTDEQIKAHDAFRKELEDTYYTAAEKRAAKKAAKAAESTTTK